MVLILTIQLGWAQGIIIQPPVFTPFECTEFYKLYTGLVTNFSEEAFSTQLLLEVDYTSPSGNRQRLADGILKGNPATIFPIGATIIDNTTYENLFSDRQINFYDSEIENLISTSKCLPPGDYEVCLTLFDINTPVSSAEFLTQTCYFREKQMFSPLLLVSPFENDEVQIDLPLFTWTAVTPFNPHGMYRIQIVELLANQTPFEAFRSNPVFFEQAGLMSNIFQYPIAARTMLPCTEYAWRVTYELQGRFVSSAFQKVPDFLQQSEIWVFNIPCNEEDEEEEEEELLLTKEYFKTNIYEIKTYQYKEDKFRFEIDNPYAEGTNIDYTIENESGRTLNTNCCPILNDNCKNCEEDRVENNSNGGLKNGKNLLRIETQEVGLKDGEFYTIKFKGLKEDLQIKFKFIEDEE